MTTQDPNNTFTTPPGRIVGGSLSGPQIKGYDNVPLEKPKWVVMLALPKTHPGTVALVAQIKRIGAEGFADNPATVQRADFSWKMIDGDSGIPNQRGIAPNTKPGYPGHTILTLSTTFAFPTVGEDPSTPISAAAVETGHWVRIAGHCKANGSATKPGVYLNLQAAQFVRADEVIQTGGGMSAAQTAQAFAAPVAPTTPAATVTPAVPAHDIVTAVAGPPPVPAAPQLVLTAKGVQAGCDPAAWMAGGEWNADNLRSNGYIQ